MNCKKMQKPYEIIDFDYIFKRHLKKPFIAKVKRKNIIRQVDKFLKADKIKSPLLLILGESGIGKTALLANIAYNNREDIIHYFIEYESDCWKPEVFKEHLFFALGWKYKLDTDNIKLKKQDLLQPLIRRIKEISKNHLKKGETQAILIDALDESIVPEDTFYSDSIVSVLNSISKGFPHNFRLIVSSSCKINKLRFLDSCDESNIIEMSGKEEGNQADIKEYFRNNLSSIAIEKEGIRMLVAESEGNFQYSHFATQSIRKKEVDARYLRNYEPHDLKKLYDRKIQRIINTIGYDEKVNDVWRIMRMLAFLTKPHSLKLICNILGIDQMRKEEYFCHIEQFLNRLSYDSKPAKCVLFRRNFNDYIFENSSREQLSDVYKTIAEYVADCIESHRFNFPPCDLLDFMDWFYFEEFDFSKLVNLARSYFRQIPKNEINPFIWGTRPFLCTCLKAAENTGIAKDILFFSFLLSAYDYFHEAHDSPINNPLSPESIFFIIDPLYKRFFNFSSEHIIAYPRPISLDLKWPLESLDRKDAANIAIGAINKFLNKDMKFNLLECNLRLAFYPIRSQFDNINEVYNLCEHYANEWFPSDDKKQIENNEDKSLESTKVDIIAPSAKQKSPIKLVLKLRLPDKKRQQPTVIYGGKLRSGIYENSFVILLNLAARRKKNKPENRLAHVVKDLKSEIGSNSCITNLQRDLKKNEMSELVKPSGNKDGEYYLDFEPEDIEIDKSIRQFKSTHRSTLKNRITDRNGLPINIKDLTLEDLENIEEWYKKMKRNEDVVDDAIKCLGWRPRSRVALNVLIEIYKPVSKELNNHYKTN